MDKQQLAKIIENVFPQLYLNEEGWDLEWGNKVFMSLDGDVFEYITYNTKNLVIRKNHHTLDIICDDFRKLCL